jgi:ABC-type lipoprotein export system ATPase subunit
VATHDLRIAELADRIIRMEDGVLTVQSDSHLRVSPAKIHSHLKEIPYGPSSDLS